MVFLFAVNADQDITSMKVSAYLLFKDVYNMRILTAFVARVD
jgi:hypothetical protein